MKIAINLVGVSYFTGNDSCLPRDWKLSMDNINQCVISPLKTYHTVDTYVTTYPHSTIDELLDFYKPRKYTLLEFENSYMKNTMLISLKELLNEDIDFIIISRFDANYHNLITNLKILGDKFNFPFRETEGDWISHACVGDGFFAFPKCYLNAFIESIKEEMENPIRPGLRDLHTVYPILLKKLGADNISFIIDGNHSSIHNPIYNLVRA